MTRWKTLFWLVLILVFMKPGSVWSRVFMNQDQALALAFSSGTTVERKNLFLTDQQKNEIEKSARSRVESNLVTYYIGVTTAGVSGAAFFNSHVVRTMPETLMAVVNPDGTLRFVELLAFYEPEDYIPPLKWMTLFNGKKMDDDLWVKRGIRNVTGATLTSQAITESVRRILATYETAVMPVLRDKK